MEYRRYKVTRRYQSGCNAEDPIKVCLAGVGTADSPGRITLREGQVVELPIDAAAWLGRDCPGVLEELEG